MQAIKILRWVLPLLIAAVWMGCDGQRDSGGSEAATSLEATPGAPASQPSQEALVILAKADSFDGAEDRVISKCLTCSLGMAGNAEHTSQFGSYELHLCSETCKESFDADPEKAVLTAKLPATLR